MTMPDLARDPRVRFTLVISSLVCLNAMACGGAGGDVEHPSGGSSAPGGAPDETGGSGVDSSGGKTSGGGAVNSGGTAGSGVSGCGLNSAAFCDTFDAASSNNGRAGDLDSAFWSAGRLKPQLPTKPAPFVAAAAAAPEGCREGLGKKILPPYDILVCAPTQGIPDSHLFISTSLQNYGVNSVRVKQPFDFAGRTGKVVFDGELTTTSLLYGFVSLAITEDPVDATSFSLYQNNEGGALPRNAITFQFQEPCFDAGVNLSSIVLMDEYVQEIHSFDSGSCISRARGQLSHVEVEISESHVRVLAGALGRTPELIQELDVELPFSRGYVQLNVHNHATLKYGSEDGAYAQPFVAWTARFDNVGFDGPEIEDFREYEYPDSLEDAGDEGVAVGYLLSGSPRSFEFTDVDAAGLDRGVLSFSLWVNQIDVNSPAINYRINGGATHQRELTDFEINLDGVGQGAMALSLDVQPSELVKGKNKVEVWTSGIGDGYPPALANLNLVLLRN